MGVRSVILFQLYSDSQVPMLEPIHCLPYINDIPKTLSDRYPSSPTTLPFTIRVTLTYYKVTWTDYRHGSLDGSYSLQGHNSDFL